LNKINEIKFKPARLSDQVRDALKQAIKEGKLTVGEALPTNQEMAARFSVSKVTLREALRDLESDGLVENRKGPSGGTFITEPSSARVRDCILYQYQFSSLSPKEWAEFRLAIEPGVAAVAAVNRTEADIESMKENIRRTTEDLEAGRSEINSHLEFHLLLAKATGNPLTANLMEAVIMVFEDVWSKITLPDGLLRKDLEFNEQLLNCLLNKDSGQAMSIMVRHFETTMSFINAL
jgi:GntR family transcriptional repressor for pyruvate dehydrogenase complex